MDQAATLRMIARQVASGRPMQILSVTSGKGGVGKTNLVCNMAARFGQLGRRVLLIDADLGLANVDILLGLSPKATLEQLFRGESTLRELLVPGPDNVTVLPSGSGVRELANLTESQILLLMGALDELDLEFDVLLVDTAAGIGSNVLHFNAAAQDVVVVATPEPTSIADAYALIKVLTRFHGVKRFLLLVNQARDPKDARQVYRRITHVADEHLPEAAIDYLGHVPFDEGVRRAVVERRLFLDAAPEGPAAAAVRDVVDRLLHESGERAPTGNMQFFWKRLLQPGA